MNPYTAEIKHLVIKNFKLNYGKGPEAVRVNISENIVFIDIKGSLTTLETSLIRMVPDNGKNIIKSMRKQLLDSKMDYYTLEARRITNISELIIETYTFEIDFQNDRQIMIFICNKTLGSISE